MSPYIPQEERRAMDNGLSPHSAGQLNYSISDMIRKYMYREFQTPGYDTFNEVMGVLSCVQQELYRKVIAEYEDKRCEENGDVF